MSSPLHRHHPAGEDMPASMGICGPWVIARNALNGAIVFVILPTPYQQQHTYLAQQWQASCERVAHISPVAVSPKRCHLKDRHCGSQHGV